MKTILIATDFSSAARNASIYAVALAKVLNAKIILCNAYKIPAASASLNVSVSRYDIMVQTNQRLLDEADFLDPEKKMIEISCDEGFTEDVIINTANEKKADFIVCGMKGSGKNFRKIFGSTAIELAKKSNVAIILIPEDAKFIKPETIMFASDLGLDINIHSIPRLDDIIQLFKSKLHVVTVVKNKNEEWFEVLNMPKRAGKIVQAPDMKFENHADNNISYGLNEFIKKYDANMLVMMPHKQEWLERIFKKSETKNMIFHTHIPLLILPEVSSEISSVAKNELKNKEHA